MHYKRNPQFSLRVVSNDKGTNPLRHDFTVWLKMASLLIAC